MYTSFPDCPKEFIKKIEDGPKLKLAIKKEGDGLNWQVAVGELSVTTLMKVGEPHSVGAHSPSYKVRSNYLHSPPTPDK